MAYFRHVQLLGLQRELGQCLPHGLSLWRPRIQRLQVSNLQRANVAIDQRQVPDVNTYRPVKVPVVNGSSELDQSLIKLVRQLMLTLLNNNFCLAFFTDNLNNVSLDWELEENILVLGRRVAGFFLLQDCKILDISA